MGMGSDMYRQQILDHYKNPRNKGEMEDPTFHTPVRTRCAAMNYGWMSSSTKTKKPSSGRVPGDGCAISQASASMLSQELAGTALADLEEMDTDDVTEMLGVDISPMRIKCAVLARQVAQDGAAFSTVRKTSTER
ncbi:FeS assembly protein SufA [Halogeometricum sp. wsp3]|nr:FeS assembly protein SufA [Halogeometricum sp. wsp3]